MYIDCQGEMNKVAKEDVAQFSTEGLFSSTDGAEGEGKLIEI